MRRRMSILLILFLLGAIAAGTGAKEAESPKPDPAPRQKESPKPKDDYYEFYKVLVDTMDQVERNYVKEVDRRELLEAAIEGVLSKLDPYSTYINPDELDRFRTAVESEFGGIGIQISTQSGSLEIISPLVGTPGYRAGLLSGDHIIEIDGVSTKGIKLDEAVRRLKGKEGTKVTLTVVHRGSPEKHEITVTREVVHIETVLGDRRKDDDSWNFTYDEDKNIGYIRLTAFSRDTADELRKALKEVTADKLQGLVIDLRFNPGGLLGSAIEVSDLFVDKGRIVSTSGRNSPERTWDAKSKGSFTGFPMAVLVNRYSASASEIVSACLQDHKRAVVVGERTWGKGSVQNVIELEGGRSVLKLTTASYRRPSGKNIHRFRGSKDEDEDEDEWGVVPDEDFPLKLGDGELVKLMEARRKHDILRPDHSETDEVDKFVDRQLEMALRYIESELDKQDAKADKSDENDKNDKDDRDDMAEKNDTAAGKAAVPAELSGSASQ